eukprot:GEMP01071448.1.p1 GENE.GEMP01071448.1~~GEMP01071448.1.p1  ORF type:complete len:131 (+),score=29.01 GEMP01071448.1:208-600(+)
MGCAQHRAVPTDAWPFRRFESLNVERSASDGALWDSAHWTTWMFCVDVRVKVNDKVLHCYIHEVEVVIDANAVCLTGEKWCLRCEADRGMFSIADELVAYLCVRVFLRRDSALRMSFTCKTTGMVAPSVS